MFCKNCGKQLLDGTPYCTSCGAPQTVRQYAEQAYMNQTPTPTTNLMPNPAPTQYNMPAQPASKAPMVLGIIGFICSIVSIVFCWAYCAGLLPAIAAVILCSISKKKGGYKIAKPGLVMGIIGIPLNIVVLIFEIVALYAMLRTTPYYF